MDVDFYQHSLGDSTKCLKTGWIGPVLWIPVKQLNSEKNADINKEEVVEIYTRYLKPYAHERLDIDWMARTKVERRLKSGLVIPEIFNESLQLACARFVAKLSKFLQSTGVLLN